MRKILILATTSLLALSVSPSFSQDSAAESAESGAREILADPRLQNLIRSAKDDPEAMAEELQDDPEAAVREATRIFQENRDKVDTSAIDTPENRKKAEALSSAALTRANEMVKEKTGKTEATAPAKPEKVPATRAVTTTTQVATPVAMPVEGVGAPISDRTSESPVIQNETVTALSNSQPTEAQIPKTPHLTETDVPAPQPLKPKYNTAKATSAPSSGKDYMEIKARESIMDSKNGVLTFRGDVFVDHPDYDLQCEKLEIQLTESIGAPGGSASAAPAAIKRAIATGGMVEIKRIGEDGKVQVALARKADYDAINQEFVLSGGPPYIQDGDRFVKTTSQDSQIIMRGNGTYEILGSGAGTKSRNTIRIPVPKSNGSDPGIGGALGSGVDLTR